MRGGGRRQGESGGGGGGGGLRLRFSCLDISHMPRLVPIDLHVAISRLHS